MLNRSGVLFWMLLFLAAVAAVVLLLARPLGAAFMANPIFNGTILAVLVIGILINIRQVLVLAPERRWIERFRTARGEQDMPPTRLFGSMARLLSGRDGEHFSLSALSLRTLLDGVRLRLDESRDISRYFMGLLVFLGLLGTFWGLLDTLRAVGGVIQGLGADQQAGVFLEEFKQGLEAPLSGMGTAFSSSLFGLAGAVVLGFLDLQAASAQNRFYNDLEEWLSGQTRLTSGLLGQGEEASMPAYMHALLEQTADSLDQLQRTMQRSEDDRRAADARLVELATELARLTEHGQAERRSLATMGKTQSELQSVLGRLADSVAERADQDREIRDALHQLVRGTERLHAGLGEDRERLVGGLRDEVRLLARVVAHGQKDPGA